MISFLLTSLKKLEIFTCNIGNAYLNTKYREKPWKEGGKEFGTEKGMVMITARALYGIKSFGAEFRSRLVETLKSLGHK